MVMVNKDRKFIIDSLLKEGRITCDENNGLECEKFRRLEDKKLVQFISKIGNIRIYYLTKLGYAELTTGKETKKPNTPKSVCILAPREFDH